MKVRNINGTSDNSCKCGSWLAHWKNFSSTSLKYCAEKSCTNDIEVGAHVQKPDSTDKSWYIVPLCKEHNAMTGTSIEISDSTTLVSANTQATCERR
jgi:hypothetical protein